MTSSYRSALSLNNLGVRLLVQRRVAESLGTLRQAIEMMKVAFHADTDTAGDVPPVIQPTSSIGALGLRTPMISSLERKDQPDFEWQSVSVTELYFDMNGLVGLDKCSSEDEHPAKFHAILIDNSDVGTAPSAFNPSQPDVESSIILYNLGVANLVASRLLATANAPKAQALLRNTERLLELAITVVSSGWLEPTDQPLYAAVVLQLGWHMTACRARALRAEGRAGAARAAVERCHAIAAALHRMGLPIRGGHCAAAAA